MSEVFKYAILDTDFVSKANIIKADNRVLADEVLGFPGYKFYCHQKMKEELGDHGTRSSEMWLDDKIKTGSIQLYTDKQILDELREETGDHCYAYYRSFLKDGCDMFDSSFYSEFFGDLDKWIENKSRSKDFLSVLRACEDGIGHQRSYGEVKAYVLLRTIRFLHSGPVFIFCSDDQNARKGFANTALIPCISILSVFYKLKLLGKTFEETQPYYQSFIDWCLDRENPQTNVKVWAFKEGAYKRERVSVEGLLKDIYAGVYVVRKDGDLQIRQIDT